jgi:ferredoxin
MDPEAGMADPNLCQYCMRCVQDCPDGVLTFIDMTGFFYKRMEMDHETPESLRKKQSRIYG